VKSTVKVLLVEDNPADALLLRMALGADAGEQFVVSETSRLGDAIARAKAESVDLVILDLGLPDAHGLDTFVRAHAALPAIPIIVLSGLGDEKVALRAVHQGAQDYFVKGTAMQGVLPRAIHYAIERHRTQRQLEDYARDLEEKHAILEEELRMAREVQEAWLPRNYPQFSSCLGSRTYALHFFHYYRPAATLSGDFFTVLRLSDNQAGVLICDVMGHGVRAALIGALARGLVERFVSVAADPGEFLTRLNHELSRILKQAGIEAFASAFYFVADVAGRELRYSNAGHPSALLLRRDARVVECLDNGTGYPMPLGLVGETRYQSFRRKLGGRDSVVVFTDGLYEEENAKGEQFGQQRILDAVTRRMFQPFDTLLEDVVHESQKFSGHEEFSDDVCLVGMEVVDGPAPGVKAA
jgi:sigma-B regulation protein RsbU (phosphoserine phosphatase)